LNNRLLRVPCGSEKHSGREEDLMSMISDFHAVEARRTGHGGQEGWLRRSADAPYHTENTQI
jgi:hypothetical protein